MVGGFGRGMNGAAGAFTPAEQAWLACIVPLARRGRVYSANTAAGFFGMAAGAVLTVLPSLFNDAPGAFRSLFLIVASGSLFNLILLAHTPELTRPAPRPCETAKVLQARVIRRRENRLLLRLVMLNSFNGFAIGLVGPLIAYWFALRFNVGPAYIAPWLAMAFVLTAVTSLATGRLTERIGLVRSVVALRAVGLLLLLLLPLMPVYTLAAVLYALRSAANRGSLGARQAVVISLVGDERRGWASSLNASSFVFSQALGPTIAGALFDAGQWALPFYLAGLLQSVYLVAYWRTFRGLEARRPAK